MKRRNLTNPYSIWFTFPALIVYSIFIVIPIFASLFLSFTDWNVNRWNTPEFAGIVNYVEILSDDVFFTSLKNTLIFSFCTTILKMTMGLALALVLAKQFKGNGIYRTIFYLPCVISITVIGVLFTAILSTKGLLNNTLALLNLDVLKNQWLGQYGSAMTWIIIIESWMWAGFNMFIFISGLHAIPSDYYEAADIDGVTKLQQFFHITLPLLIPAITVNVTLNIAGGMKVFDIVFILTNGGPGNVTQVLSTFVYKSFTAGWLGESSAASIILTILVVVISFTLNKIFRNMEVEA